MLCTGESQCKYETFLLITQDQGSCMQIPYWADLGLNPSFATSAVCVNLDVI